MVQLTPVKSSNLAAIGYDAAQRILAVRFTGASDKVHHYHDVPPEAHQALMAAESIGSHFAKQVRSQFRHTVELDEEEGADA